MKIEIRKLKQWYYENADILQDLFQIWYTNLSKKGISFTLGHKNRLFNKWIRFVYIETGNPIIYKCEPTPFINNDKQDNSPLIIKRK